MSLYRIQTMLYALTLIGFSLILFACGDGQDTVEQQGELRISLTDAEGDFTTYTVDVLSITLFKSNGAVVETLPNTMRLDFARYVEVTEFLTNTSVPAGIYQKAEITLDYSNSLIEVEGLSGNSIPAQALDEQGNALTSITLETVINTSSGFQIIPGLAKSLTLDFDLEASNQVSINGDSATLRVNPVLIANTGFETDRTQRLRGLLKSVNLPEESFVVGIRPFRSRHQDFGEITAFTSTETQFEIDGVSYRRLEGLEALAQKDALTPVVTLGTVNSEAGTYVADEVYAGSSVPWSDRDGLDGSVIARDANVLTVIGATVEFDDGRFSFNDRVEVLLDNGTTVNKQGSAAMHYSIDDISVGQKVRILGQMSEDGRVMDAGGDGIVRMQYSHVAGLVVSVSPLEVDLQHINRRSIESYDFSGTGIDMANDADPHQYEIDQGFLSLNSLALSEPVRIKGHVTPFGGAPADFDAKTIVDLSNVQTNMFIAYGSQGSATAVVSLDQNGLMLDLAGVTDRHHLKQSGIITDIADLPSVPFIQPVMNGGLFALSEGRRLRIYRDWNNYQAELNSLLRNGRKVIFAIARGLYDGSRPTLDSRQLIVRITD